MQNTDIYRKNMLNKRKWHSSHAVTMRVRKKELVWKKVWLYIDNIINIE